MKLPHADFSVLGLGIKWRGRFWVLGFGGEHGRGELGLEPSWAW